MQQNVEFMIKQGRNQLSNNNKEEVVEEVASKMA